MIYHVKHIHTLIIWQAFATLQTSFQCRLENTCYCAKSCVCSSFAAYLQLVCSSTSVHFQYTKLILIGPTTCQLTNPESYYIFWRLASCFEPFGSILRQCFVQRTAVYWTKIIELGVRLRLFPSFSSTNKEQDYSLVYSDFTNG